MTKKPEGRDLIKKIIMEANEAKNTVYEAAGIKDTEKLEVIENEQEGERKIEKLERIANESKEPKKMGFFKKMCLGIGLGLGAVFFSVSVTSGVEALCYHNKEYKNSGFYTMSKCNGPFLEKTKIKIYTGGTEVTRMGGLFGGLFTENISYIDENGDGKVDKIKEYDYLTTSHWFNEDDIEQEFDRSKHYEKHAEKFKEADKDFQKQLERFKPYIENWEREERISELEREYRSSFYDGFARDLNRAVEFLGSFCSKHDIDISDIRINTLNDSSKTSEEQMGSLNSLEFNLPNYSSSTSEEKFRGIFDGSEPTDYSATSEEKFRGIFDGVKPLEEQKD